MSQNQRQPSLIISFLNILKHLKQCSHQPATTNQHIKHSLQQLAQLNTIIDKLGWPTIQTTINEINKYKISQSNDKNDMKQQDNIELVKIIEQFKFSQCECDIKALVFIIIRDVFIESCKYKMGNKFGICLCMDILFDYKYQELFNKNNKWTSYQCQQKQQQQYKQNHLHKIQKYITQKLIWINPKVYPTSQKNILFYDCINTILLQLQKGTKQYDFVYVSQCIYLAYRLLPYVPKLKIMQFILYTYKQGTSILNNTSINTQQSQKQSTTTNMNTNINTNLNLNLNLNLNHNTNIKQITPKSIKSLKQTLEQIIKQLQTDKTINRLQLITFKKNVQLTSNNFGLLLLNNQSIQKRLIGLKLINCLIINDNQFIQWIKNNQVLQSILKQNNQEIFVSNAAIIFKTVLKNIKENKELLHFILDYALKSKSELRRCILRYVESVTFSDYYSIHDQIIGIFIKNSQSWFVTEDVWDIIIKFVSKISYRKIQQVLPKLINFYLYSQSEQIKQFTYKCKSTITDLFLKFLDKKTTSLSQQQHWQKITQFYNQLLQSPIKTNKLTLLTSITQKIMQNKSSYLYKQLKRRIADYLITQHFVIDMVLLWLKIQQYKAKYQSLEKFVVYLIDKCSENIRIRFIMNYQLLVKSLRNVKILNRILQYYQNKKQLKNNFRKFIQKCYQQQQYNNSNINNNNNNNSNSLASQAILHYFFALNNNKIVYFHDSDSFQILQIPSNLQGKQTIITCLMDSKNSKIRDQLAQLFADICTSYSQKIKEQGKNYLISIFLECVQNLQLQYNFAMQEQSNTKLLGSLSIIKQLMMATEIQGVGNLKPHNSLVATHYINVEINDQTRKFKSYSKNKYQKRLPGNMILMQLIQQVCDMFLYDMYQFKLMDGKKCITHKHYGLTLQQLNINNKVLRIVQGKTRQIINKETIVENNKLTDKAKKIFTQFYHYFTKNQQFGINQCLQFINQVTKTEVKITEERVQNFMRKYSKNGKVSLQNFLKFYTDKASDGMYEDIWKNLKNMSYRQDLKKIFQPRDPLPEQLLFRTYLSQNDIIYQTLFITAKSNDKQLKQRSIQLLLRLPSIKINNHQKQLIQLTDPFQIQYFLISIQNQLQIGSNIPQHQQKRKQFIKQNRISQIFKIMDKIYYQNKQNKQKNNQDENCLLICIKFLRSLCTIPDLRQKLTIQTNIQIQKQFQVHQTNIFVSMLKLASTQKDIQLIQWLFTLQITQIYSNQSANLLLSQAINVIFDRQNKIRQIACNYIYILSILGKDVSQISQIKIQQNCIIWYETLSKILQRTNIMNNDNILQNSITILQSKKQTIQNMQDPSIYGNLIIILSIIKNKKRNLTFQKMINITQQVISPKSRKIIYEIMSYLDLSKTVMYIKQIINNYSIQNNKDLSPKYKYVGLNNLGSTCYVNSVLQLLFWNKNFRNQLINLHQQKSIKINNSNPSQNSSNNQIPTVLQQIQNIFIYLQNSYNKYYDMSNFVKIYIDKRNQLIDIKKQQDAHQFYSHFLQLLQNYFEKYQKKQVFDRLITGKTVYQFICCQCDRKFQKIQKFQCLTLQVKNYTSFNQSIKKYVRPQEIQDYTCENCNRKAKKITRYTKLSQLPDYLVINLHRMELSIELYRHIKIGSKFQFSEFINLSEYVYNYQKQHQQQYKYRLKATIIHSGTAMSGHYYSIINTGEKWHKFDDKNVYEYQFKDLEKEAFGGNSDNHSFQFQDQNFSTCAYILCYQRCNLKQKVYQKQKIDPLLSQKIKRQKQCILDQIKICNDSIFQFFIDLFNKNKPQIIQDTKNSSYKLDWSTDKNLQKNHLFYDLSMSLLKFMKKFWKLTNPANIPNLGSQILYLLYLLPEMSYSFLQQTTQQQCKYMLCYHQEINVRNMYKHILTKSLHIFYTYYGYKFDQEQTVVQHVKNIICNLKILMQNLYFFENIYQLDSYFQFWAVCVQYIQPIFNYMIKTDIFLQFISILQHDSTPHYNYNNAQQKYQQMKQMKQQNKQKFKTIPLKIASNLCGIIQFLVKHKFNQSTTNKKDNSLISNQFTQKQKKALSSTALYSNILNNQYDKQNYMSTVIACLSKNNQNFSKQMAQIFLKGLKSYEDRVRSLQVMMEYIGYFLQIDDYLFQKRMKWILGISQLAMGDVLTFGFPKNNLHSHLFQYMSTLYFSEFNKYPPILHKLTLYSEPNSQNKSTIFLLAFILSMSNHNGKILEYLHTLPSPSHFYLNYFDWLNGIIMRLQEMNDSCFTHQRKDTQKNMTQLYFALKQKISTKNFKSKPQHPFIIGRNKNLDIIFSKQILLFNITVYSHQTYILMNESNDFKNQTIPNNFFQLLIGKLFVSKKQQADITEQQIKAMGQKNLPFYRNTVQSWVITTETPLKLKFNIGQFNQQIYLQIGKSFINLPYRPIKITEQNWNQFLQYQKLNIDEVTWSNRKFSYIQNQNTQNIKNERLVQIIEDKRTKFCPLCTFQNQYQDKQCNMCLTPFQM